LYNRERRGEERSEARQLVSCSEDEVINNMRDRDSNRNSNSSGFNNNDVFL
jgi:hypothetical protein